MTPRPEELDEGIRDFALTKEASDRIPKLARLFDLVEEISPEDLAFLITSTPMEEKLAHTVNLALRTPFRTDQGERIIPWEGATVVLLGKDEIAGGLSQSAEGMQADSGDNLFPSAIQKALLVMALDLDQRTGGLENRDNFRHIEEMGLRKRLFMGGATVPWPDSHHYLGVSGCAFRGDYVEGLFPPDQTMHENLAIDFLTEYAESCFAKLVAGYLLNPRTAITPVSEPQLISVLRKEM